MRVEKYCIVKQEHLNISRHFFKIFSEEIFYVNHHLLRAENIPVGQPS